MTGVDASALRLALAGRRWDGPGASPVQPSMLHCQRLVLSHDG